MTKGFIVFGRVPKLARGTITSKRPRPSSCQPASRTPSDSHRMFVGLSLKSSRRLPCPSGHCWSASRASAACRDCFVTGQPGIGQLARSGSCPALRPRRLGQSSRHLDSQRTQASYLLLGSRVLRHSLSPGDISRTNVGGESAV